MQILSAPNKDIILFLKWTLEVSCWRMDCAGGPYKLWLAYANFVDFSFYKNEVSI